MPFPYFENISTDFTGTWSSPRKRKASEQETAPQTGPAKRKTTRVACPHHLTTVRSSRQLVVDTKRCPICLEDYFSTPADREKVTPVKLDCSHIFCHECIESHLCSSIRCPLPWCETHVSLQPDTCNLCAIWQKNHAPNDSLVVTVRANEMLGSIKDALSQLAADNDFYKLPKRAKDRLFKHISITLKRYEWQYHSGIDLAELLDPFLLAVDRDAARKHYGPKLSSAPAPSSTCFPPREPDSDDYPAGKEPWIAAFFRQWAMDYADANGEVKEGWGVWANKAVQQGSGWSWEWPYKRIIAHRTTRTGQVEYLLKWVGQRHASSWVEGERLDPASRAAYDKAHGVVHEVDQKQREADVEWASHTSVPERA